MSILRKTLRSGISSVFLMLTQAQPLYAFPQDHWVLQSGEQLEVLRDHVCFEEGRAGERNIFQMVTFSKDVLSAEVFISGYDIWQQRGGDSEVARLRVDAHVKGIGIPNPDNPSIIGSKNKVQLEFIYAFYDEDPTWKEDYNRSCIGFTVIAKTK